MKYGHRTLQQKVYCLIPRETGYWVVGVTYLVILLSFYVIGGDGHRGNRGDGHRGGGHRGDGHRGDGHRGDDHRGDGHRGGHRGDGGDGDVGV